MKKLVVAHDEVFIVEKETACKHVVCTICDGTGNVRIKQKVFVCPQCNGAGSRLEQGVTDWRVKGPATLKSVLLSNTKEGVVEEYTYDVPTVSDYYSGTYTVKKKLKDVFSTFDEAVEEAHRRNMNEAQALFSAREGVAV